MQAGPPSLHYYCAVVLHSCNVLPPVGHSSNHEYHCCQLKRQSSCVSNFYRTFRVFIWLSLVRMDDTECWLYSWISHREVKERMDRSNEEKSNFADDPCSGWPSAETWVDVRKLHICHSIRDNWKSRMMSQLLEFTCCIERSEQEWLKAQKTFYFYVIMMYDYLCSKCENN
jgi:hypothetical protein